MRQRLLITLFVFFFVVSASAQDFASSGPSNNPSNDGPIEKATIDLGMAAGTRATHTYTEFNLALSAYFSEYFAWRNAFFGHKQSNIETFYGLDSSARWILPFRRGDSGFAIFFGPGLRLPFKGEIAPSLEGGIWLKQGALSFGAGAKSIVNSLVRSHEDDEIQFFIFLGFGPTL